MYKPRVSELTQLIGNPEVYALQKKEGGYTPVREPLTKAVLRAHRRGEMTVGTYIVHGDQARTLVFDIDSPSGAEQREMLAKVRKVLDDMFLTYFVEYSGSKGYHVWVVAEEMMSAATLYQLGRGVRNEAELPKLEVFPKQTTVKDLGNLVKLPGGFHAKTGNANDLLDQDDDPVTGPGWPENLLVKPEYLEKLAALYPEVTMSKSGPDTVEYPCVHTIQDGVESNRNIHLYHLAAMLRRWSLTDENIEAILRRANERSAEGGVDEDELHDILENSRQRAPLCGQLDDDVHCGDQCILARHDGLYTRRGAVKWAQPGEKVVLEVASRTDGGRIMELAHDDIVQGKLSLKDPAPRKKRSSDD